MPVRNVLTKGKRLAVKRIVWVNKLKINGTDVKAGTPWLSTWQATTDSFICWSSAMSLWAWPVTTACYMPQHGPVSHWRNCYHCLLNVPAWSCITLKESLPLPDECPRMAPYHTEGIANNTSAQSLWVSLCFHVMLLSHEPKLLNKQKPNTDCYGAPSK